MGAELRAALVMVALDGRVLQRPVHSLDLTVAQGWFGPVRRYDERRCKDRWPVEAMFCRLKDFRPHRHPIPQARPQLPGGRKSRRRCGLLALNESEP